MAPVIRVLNDHTDSHERRRGRLSIASFCQIFYEVGTFLLSLDYFSLIISKFERVDEGSSVSSPVVKQRERVARLLQFRGNMFLEGIIVKLRKSFE